MHSIVLLDLSRKRRWSKDFRDYFKLNDNNNEVEETEMEESDESSEQVTESKTPLTDDFMDDLDNELPFC